MDLIQIDEHGQLFISPAIDDWAPVAAQGINVIFDLDRDLDIGVPTVPDQVLYIYYPFEDRDLPQLEKLNEIAILGARLVEEGYHVLVHCGMGHNRSALLAGVILTYLGMPGPEAIRRIRQKRPVALYNAHFASYLQELPARAIANPRAREQKLDE